MQRIRDSLSQAITSSARNVAAFEEEMAGYLGCTSAVGVNSGTVALHLPLRALEINPGDDEVIATPFTFIATTESICKRQAA